MRDDHDYLDEMDFYADEPRARHRKPRKPKRSHREVMDDLVESDEHIEGGFAPSFSASRHERAWIITYLGPFYAEHLITDVLRQVKGGKEATVYCCQAHPSVGVPLVAAKVYRPRMFRNLRNDARYRAGREVHNDQSRGLRNRGEMRAIQKRSAYGQELLHASWLAHEFGSLRLLHNAGVAVPRPYALGENAILMEYLGDEKLPASTLNHVRLSRAEAHRLFDEVLAHVELMLAHQRVHGDLSAFNILYWQGQFKIIDFPQAINPYANPEAFAIFNRDVVRVCQYFAPYGIKVDPTSLALELWGRYMPTEEFLLEYPESG